MFPFLFIAYATAITCSDFDKCWKQVLSNIWQKAGPNITKHLAELCQGITVNDEINLDDNARFGAYHSAFSENI